MAMYDLNSSAGLAAFDDYLKSHSYATGFVPSNEDIDLFGTLNSEPHAKYKNLVRWYRNIASFNEEERKKWRAVGVSPKAEKVETDGDFDLFGSEEDEEKAEVTAARLKVYDENRAKKPKEVAKSNIIFDVKPWDDTIKIEDIEKNIRTISSDGLVWGSAKTMPIAYGIQKLQICCVVEDDKVSLDWLEEQITGFDDLVQSIDIVAFNKV